MRSNIIQWRFAEECEIRRCTDVDDRRCVSIIEIDIDAVALIAVLFTVVEVFENVGLDQVRASVTAFARGFNKCHDPAGVALYAAMIVRALPEATRPACDKRAMRIEIGKVRPPDQ